MILHSGLSHLAQDTKHRPVAQLVQSASLTRKRSMVRIHSGLPSFKPFHSLSPPSLTSRMGFAPAKHPGETRISSYLFTHPAPQLPHRLFLILKSFAGR